MRNQTIKTRRVFQTAVNTLTIIESVQRMFWRLVREYGI